MATAHPLIIATARGPKMVVPPGPLLQASTPSQKQSRVKTAIHVQLNSPRYCLLLSVFTCLHMLIDTRQPSPEVLIILASGRQSALHFLDQHMLDLRTGNRSMEMGSHSAPSTTRQIRPLRRFYNLISRGSGHSKTPEIKHRPGLLVPFSGRNMLRSGGMIISLLPSRINQT